MFIANLMKVHRKSIFMSWLISYFTILCIPIIISSLVYYQAGNMIKHEIIRANKAILNQAAQILDGSMEDIWKLGLELSLNEKVKALMYIKKPLDHIDRYNIGKVVKSDLALTKTISKFLTAFYIYCNNGDFVLRSGGYYEPEVAYSDFHRNSSLSYEEWYQLIQEKHDKSSLSLGVHSSYGEDESTISYIHSFPFIGTRVDANFIALLNKNYVNDIIENMEWIQKGTFLILDHTNEILISNTSEYLSFGLSYEELSLADDILYQDIQGKPVIISYVSSTIMDWKYISIFPADIFMERVSYIRTITFYSLLLCMFLGAGAAYIFAKRNYNPIGELVTIFKGREKGNTLISENEYQFITDSIRNALQEKEEIGKQLKRKKNEMRQYFFERLLRGKVDTLTLDDLLSSYGIDFNTGTFAVVLFQTQEDSDFPENIASIDPSAAEQDILHIIDTIYHRNHKCYMTQTNGMFACIIHFSCSNIDQSGLELNFILADIREFVQKSNPDSPSLLSFSRIHGNISGIQAAYKEALETVEYRKVMGSENILFYEDILNCSNVYDYPIETEVQLMNSIKTGDFQQVKQLLDAIFQSNFNDNPLSLEMARCLMFDLTSTMIKASHGCNLIDNEIHLAGTFFHHQTVGEMKKSMEDLLQKVCLSIENQKGSHNTTLKNDIISYIELHYQDSDLSNTTLAETFHMNPAYLSRFFKEQTGEGLLNYIHSCRLKKAKELLLLEKGTLEEIANAVGYYNNIALIRAFKKYEGITPGKYKEMYKIHSKNQN